MTTHPGWSWRWLSDGDRWTHLTAVWETLEGEVLPLSFETPDPAGRRLGSACLDGPTVYRDVDRLRTVTATSPRECPECWARLWEGIERHLRTAGACCENVGAAGGAP